MNDKASTVTLAHARRGKISKKPSFQPEDIELGPNHTITTLPEAKCLDTWWTHHLSAVKSVQENICKARKALFAFGKIEAFQGHLNPLSAVSIYKTCVLPILLYGSEKWLLTQSSVDLLERF